MIVATWPDGVMIPFRVRRFPWWLTWWPSRNVTFGHTIFEGGPVGINEPTLRHELTHVRQYAEYGWLWVWTHPRQREADARIHAPWGSPIWSIA